MPPATAVETRCRQDGFSKHRLGVVWWFSWFSFVFKYKRCENIKPIGLGSSFGAASRPCIVRRQWPKATPAGRGSWRGIGRMRTAHADCCSTDTENQSACAMHTLASISRRRVHSCTVHPWSMNASSWCMNAPYIRYRRGPRGPRPAPATRRTTYHRRYPFGARH